MKSIKYMNLMVALTVIITLGLTACGSEDDDEMPAKPVVTLTEVGHDNSRHAHPGHDLHLEVTVVAEGLINRIDIEIHKQEDASATITQVYTEGKYIGVRNTEFHEHIDIPETFSLGTYHLHFTVTDQKGQQTLTESELFLVEGDGEEHEHE